MKKSASMIVIGFTIITAIPLRSQDAPSASEYSAGDPRLAIYLEQALSRNPGILQSFARYQAARARLPQVSSLPDPLLNVTNYLRSPETRVGAQTTMLSLSQKLPWFGKLSGREKIAAKEAAVYRYIHEAKRRDVVREVKLVYYDLGYIDRALDITREEISVLEHHETLARARYEQGVGLQQGVVKLQAEITRGQNRLEELGRQRVDLESVLNSLRDLPADSPVEKIRPPRRAEVRIDRDELYRIGRNHNPEIQAALLQIEKNEKRIHLARKDYWPDFTIGAGFTNVTGRSDPAGILNPPGQDGKNIYSLSVGINIPVRRRKYDAAVAEATEDTMASREGYRDAVNVMEASVRAIGFRMETLDRQIALVGNTLLPQAEHSLRSTEAAYGTGEVGVLELLDGQRTLLDVRLGLERYASDYAKSIADLERAIGVPFRERNP
jgi:outer membrane protein TolC